MIVPQRMSGAVPRGAVLDCGTPLDAQYFDDARFEKLPPVGGSALLARVELPSQYCGVLEYFAQFTDLFCGDASQVRTPGLRWQILANGQPLFPYHEMSTILNPWGFGSFQFSIRLPQGARLELIVRRIREAVLPPETPPGTEIKTVGGRLLGRFWYDSAYGAPQ
jgi:hypothetical protein